MPVKKSKATKSTSKTGTARKQATSPRGRATSKKTSKKTSKNSSASSAGDREVTIDRRTKADRRNPRQPAQSVPKAVDRRKKVQRRRQIDPTTCERDYSEQEVEFMNAMDRYKRISGRMFPTCSEVLEVIRGLGYVQLTAAELAAIRPERDSKDEIDGAESAEDELSTAEFACEEDLL